MTFTIKSRHIVISKMVRHIFLRNLRPEKSLKSYLLIFNLVTESSEMWKKCQNFPRVQIGLR